MLRRQLHQHQPMLLKHMRFASTSTSETTAPTHSSRSSSRLDGSTILLGAAFISLAAWGGIILGVNMSTQEERHCNPNRLTLIRPSMPIHRSSRTPEFVVRKDLDRAGEMWRAHLTEALTHGSVPLLHTHTLPTHPSSSIRVVELPTTAHAAGAATPAVPLVPSVSPDTLAKLVDGVDRLTKSLEFDARERAFWMELAKPHLISPGAQSESSHHSSEDKTAAGQAKKTSAPASESKR